MMEQQKCRLFILESKFVYNNDKLKLNICQTIILAPPNLLSDWPIDTLKRMFIGCYSYSLQLGSRGQCGETKLQAVLRIRENTGSGSGSFIHKKTPCYSNFLVIKLSKIQFRPKNIFIFDFKWHNNFLSLILSVIRCLILVRKCHKNYLFC